MTTTNIRKIQMLINEALELIKEEDELSDQYDLSKTIGVSQGTISNYYKNKSYPTLHIAAKIFGKYGHRVEPFTELSLAKEWAFIEEYEL